MASRRPHRLKNAEQIIAAALARLDPVALSSAFGVVAAVTVLFATTISLVKGPAYPGHYLFLVANYFPGFPPDGAA